MQRCIALFIASIDVRAFAEQDYCCVQLLPRDGTHKWSSPHDVANVRFEIVGEQNTNDLCSTVLGGEMQERVSVQVDVWIGSSAKQCADVVGVSALDGNAEGGFSGCVRHVKRR